jgi:hypothetical protein
VISTRLDPNSTVDISELVAIIKSLDKGVQFRVFTTIDGIGRTTVGLGARGSITVGVIRAGTVAILFGGLSGSGGGGGITASITHGSSHLGCVCVCVCVCVC